jgi:mannan endo-1,4-beta-mannosidase
LKALLVACLRNSSVNTETGIKWKDDPTILAWNIMNEPRCDLGLRASCNDDMQDWLSEMASYIKKIDSKHLIGIGSEVGMLVFGRS